VDGPVLLHGEPPFGESLQFVRYAPLVAERCTGVIFECAAPLQRLLQGVSGISRTTTPAEALPPFSAHLPLFDLPRIFGTTLHTIPWQGPYVRAEATRVAEWRRLLEPQREHLKVGLAWRGNPLNPNNHDRSIALGGLGPLGNLPGVSLYSLQKDRLETGTDFPPAGMKLIDFMPRIRDFSDTAALVSCLDLVISVDTAVAHLAGAMGVGTWVLLNRIPDWRYHLERTDNPWYPTMRLYRQQHEGNWPEVVDRVAADLERIAPKRNGAFRLPSSGAR
jgi:hypothetical protein